MQNRLPDGWIERIFQRLHGRFGNTFTNKFKSGLTDANGNDTGIENAKLVWSEELAGLSPERIANGLKASYEHTPTCDDFKRACSPVISSHKDFLAIEKKITPEIKEANRIKLQKMMEDLGMRKMM